MADLIVLFGPPAVGKTTVGQALSERTGYRLFRNQLTVEPVAALFGTRHHAFLPLVDDLRITLLEAAAVRHVSVIFTFGWALDLASDKVFLDAVTERFDQSGGRVMFVELRAPLEVRQARRAASGGNARHAGAMRDLLSALDDEFRYNSAGDFFYPDRHLVVDTADASPEDAAARVVDYFGLGERRSPAA